MLSSPNRQSQETSAPRLLRPTKVQPKRSSESSLADRWKTAAGLVCQHSNGKPQCGKPGFIFNTPEQTPPHTCTVSCGWEEGAPGAAGWAPQVHTRYRGFGDHRAWDGDALLSLVHLLHGEEQPGHGGHGRVPRPVLGLCAKNPKGTPALWP